MYYLSNKYPWHVCSNGIEWDLILDFGTTILVLAGVSVILTTSLSANALNNKNPH
jgi:hypothetical protein